MIYYSQNEFLHYKNFMEKSNSIMEHINTIIIAFSKRINEM